MSRWPDSEFWMSCGQYMKLSQNEGIIRSWTTWFRYFYLWCPILYIVTRFWYCCLISSLLYDPSSSFTSFSNITSLNSQCLKLWKGQIITPSSRIKLVIINHCFFFLLQKILFQKSKTVIKFTFYLTGCPYFLFF